MKWDEKKMMKIHKNLMYSSIISVVIGIFLTMGNAFYGPIIMATGIILASFFILRNNKQHNIVLFSVITVITLFIMFSLEYFILHVQNTLFYVLLLLLSLGFIFTFIFSFKPQNILTQGEKILAWTGAIMFSIGFFGLMGIIWNDFTGSLVLGVLLLIFIMFSWLIRRKISKDDELKNEFDEIYTTERNNKSYWFNYEVGGIPKPVRLQGWACYGIILLSPMIIIFFDDTTLDTAIIVAIIFCVVFISYFKSNYKETVKEYRENLKKEKEL